MMSGLPTFRTDRLVLSEITLADVPEYEKHFIDYDVVKFLVHTIPWPYPEGGVEEYLKKDLLPKQGKENWAWKIAESGKSDELIGLVQVMLKEGEYTRGFWLGKQFWHKGYMTEALVPVMNYCFDELGVEKFKLDNAVGNTASRKIKERTGASFLGTEPARFVDPSCTMQDKWELTKEVWRRYLESKGS